MPKKLGLPRQSFRPGTPVPGQPASPARPNHTLDPSRAESAPACWLHSTDGKRNTNHTKLTLGEAMLIGESNLDLCLEIQVVDDVMFHSPDQIVTDTYCTMTMSVNIMQCNVTCLDACWRRDSSTVGSPLTSHQVFEPTIFDQLHRPAFAGSEPASIHSITVP